MENLEKVERERQDEMRLRGRRSELNGGEREGGGGRVCFCV